MVEPLIYKAPPDERGGNRHARPTATAPHLNSTNSSRILRANSGHYPTAWRMRHVMRTFETKFYCFPVSAHASSAAGSRSRISEILKASLTPAQRHLPGARPVAGLADETRQLSVLDNHLRRQNGDRIG